MLKDEGSLGGVLVDGRGRKLGVISVALEGDIFCGQVDLSCAPDDVIKLFNYFEELVEGQVLSLIDDVQNEIEKLRAEVWLEGGVVAVVKSLQVFPSSSRVTFEMVGGE